MVKRGAAIGWFSTVGVNALHFLEYFDDRNGNQPLIPKGFLLQQVEEKLKANRLIEVHQEKGHQNGHDVSH